MNDKIKINKKDWMYLKAALVTYSLEHFQSTELQNKVKSILDKLD